ncbi:MAG TPA: M48 family metallopeptidase [Candidatus Bathyarchaeia archaeon]|nr:M48 family metallopeptidase [Candidatus Bathyarchaeia archaeon]
MSTVSEMYQYDQQKRRLSKEYRNRKLTIDVLSDPILQVAVCSGLLISGLSLTISRFASTIVTWESGRVAVYAVIFLAFLFALELPVAWYEGFRIDHEFGLSHQNFEAWMIDFLKAALLSYVVIVPLSVGLYLLIQLSSFWWIWASLAYAMFELVASTVLPFVVIPMFYKLKQYSDTMQRDQLLRMAKKAGAKNIQRVMLANESARSGKANAFFTGLGGTRTMVLFDNLVTGFTPREVITVVAHELGHYVNRDIWREAGLTAILSVPEFFMANVALQWGIGRFGILSQGDPAGLPLIVIAVSLMSFLLMPISNGVSRIIERKADEFSLRMAEDPQAQASTERRLADMNLSDDRPHWLIELLFYTHPPAWKRIKLAEDWKPANVDLGNAKQI